MTETLPLAQILLRRRFGGVGGVARGRQSDVEVATLSLTLDVGHLDLLDRVVRTGLYGRNRNEAASALIRFWLSENLPALEEKYARLESGKRMSMGGA